MFLTCVQRLWFYVTLRYYIHFTAMMIMSPGIPLHTSYTPKTFTLHRRQICWNFGWTTGCIKPNKRQLIKRHHLVCFYGISYTSCFFLLFWLCFCTCHKVSDFTDCVRGHRVLLSFDRWLRLTWQADLTKMWSFAFLQHLSDRQLDINLTGRQRSIN